MTKASELFDVGQIVSFVGYGEGVEDKDKEFEEGQLLHIDAFKNDPDDGIVAQPLNEDGSENHPTLKANVVFSDEIRALPQDDGVGEEEDDLEEADAGVADAEPGVVGNKAETEDEPQVLNPVAEPAKKADKKAASKPKKATEPAKDLSPEEKEKARKARKALKDKERRARNKAAKEAAEAEANSDPEPEQTELEDAVAEAEAKDQISTNPEDRVDPEAAAVEAAEAKALGQAALEATVPAETPEETVLQMTSVESILESHDAIDAADLLIKQAEQTYFTLGGVLTHIYHHGDYKSIGFKTDRGWQKYIDERLGMHYRKVMDLIKIYEKFLAAGISEDELVRFGWSKARLLARIPLEQLTNDWDTLKDWYKKSRKEIEDGIKTTYKDQITTRDESPDKVRNVNIRVTLTGEAGETVNRAFDVAKGFAETDEEAACLEYICGEWLAMHEAVDTPIEDMIQFVEARYQVTLTVGEPAEQPTADEGSVQEDDHEEESEEE